MKFTERYIEVWQDPGNHQWFITVNGLMTDVWYMTKALADFEAEQIFYEVEE